MAFHQTVSYVLLLTVQLFSSCYISICLRRSSCIHTAVVISILIQNVSCHGPISRDHFAPFRYSSKALNLVSKHHSNQSG